VTPQRIVLGAWIAMIGLATVRYAAGANKGFPPPSVYLASGILFTLLYGASSFLGPLAATLAVGVDVGALLTPYLKGQPGLPETVASWLDGIAGGTGTLPPAGRTGTQTV
jgi:hypothetical protein